MTDQNRKSPSGPAAPVFSAVFSMAGGETHATTVVGVTGSIPTNAVAFGSIKTGTNGQIRGIACFRMSNGQLSVTWTSPAGVSAGEIVILASYIQGRLRA